MTGSNAAQLGEQAKKRRQELRLTQEEVAQRAEVHRNTVAKYEAGELPMRDLTASAIRRALNMEDPNMKDPGPSLYDEQPDYVKAFLDALMLYLEPMTPEQKQDEVRALMAWIYTRTRRNGTD